MLLQTTSWQLRLRPFWGVRGNAAMPANQRAGVRVNQAHQPYLRNLDILLVESSDEDADTVFPDLAGIATALPDVRLNVDTVRGHEAFSRLLSQTQPDVIIVDSGSGQDPALGLVEEIQARAPYATILLLAKEGSTAAAIESIHHGVQDYIVRGTDFAQSLARSILCAFERKQMLNYSGREILKDPVTGLMNRIAFLERLNYAILTSRRRSERFCLASFLFHDFDGIAATFGQESCDALLREIGQRFLDRSRETDAVARLRHNHFVAIFEQIGEPDVPVIVERVHEYLTRPFLLSVPLTETPVQLKVGATAGLSLYPEHVDQIDTEEDADRLLFAADIALESAFPDTVHNIILYDSMLFEQEVTHGREH